MLSAVIDWSKAGEEQFPFSDISISTDSSQSMHRLNTLLLRRLDKEWRLDEAIGTLPSQSQIQELEADWDDSTKARGVMHITHETVSIVAG